MMLELFYVVTGLALATMVAALALVLRLRRLTRGGAIGRVVNLMLVLIVLFTLGYLVAPWMPHLPVTASLFLSAFVFLFGALFVVVVLRVIENLVRQVLSDLKL